MRGRADRGPRAPAAAWEAAATRAALRLADEDRTCGAAHTTVGHASVPSAPVDMPYARPLGDEGAAAREPSAAGAFRVAPLSATAAARCDDGTRDVEARAPVAGGAPSARVVPGMAPTRAVHGLA